VQAATIDMPVERRRTPFYALLAANTIGGAGNNIEALAIPWFVLELTGSASKTGLTAAVAFAPVALAGLFGGTLVDRLGYRASSILSDVTSGVAIVLIPLLHFTVGLAFWQLLLLVFAGRLLDAAGFTARRSLLPELARAAGMPLTRANGLYDAVNRSALLLGPPLAGVLIAVFGAANALYANALGFALAALIVAIWVPRHLAPAAQRDGRQPYFSELAEGYRFIRGNRLILALMATFLVTNFVEAPLVIALAVYGREVLNSSVQIGIVVAFFGFGAVAGALAFSWIGERLPRRWVFPAGFSFGILLYAAFALQPPLPVLLLLGIVVGIGFGPINPMIDTIYQELVPDNMRGRVFGLRSAVAMSAMPLGVLLGGFVIDRVGLTGLFVGQAALFSLVVIWMLVAPQFRDLSESLSPTYRSGPAPLTVSPDA
jgi:MFS family permease